MIKSPARFEPVCICVVDFGSSWGEFNSIILEVLSISMQVMEGNMYDKENRVLAV